MPCLWQTLSHGKCFLNFELWQFTPSCTVCFQANCAKWCGLFFFAPLCNGATNIKWIFCQKFLAKTCKLQCFFKRKNKQKTLAKVVCSLQNSRLAVAKCFFAFSHNFNCKLTQNCYFCKPSKSFAKNSEFSAPKIAKKVEFFLNFFQKPSIQRQIYVL